MKAPSIAVMLGHGEPDGDEGAGLSGEESKSAGSDAGKAFISAVKAGNGEAAYRAFCAMADLHESGEEEGEAKKDEGYEEKSDEE